MPLPSCAQGSTPPALLQLLALTCISLAAKMEQQQAAEELVSVARDEKGQFYQPQDVTRMENHVLNTLGFRLRVPNMYTFLRLFLNRIAYSPQSSQVIPPGLEVAFHNVALNLAVGSRRPCMQSCTLAESPAMIVSLHIAHSCVELVTLIGQVTRSVLGQELEQTAVAEPPALST